MDQTADVQVHIGESLDSGFASSTRPGMTEVRPHVAIGVGMVRNARVTCQNNCRLVASVTEWAVPGRMTNWRSPFGSKFKNSSRSEIVAITSYSPRNTSTRGHTLLACTI